MKQLTVQDFGTLKNGEKAHLYIMENDRGTSAAVTDYGAALMNLRTPDKNGTLLDVVLGFDDVSGYDSGGDAHWGGRPVCAEPELFQQPAVLWGGAERIGGAAADPGYVHPPGHP